MNMLIVDDSEPMRRTIRSFIEDLADQIHECADGRNALEEYRRFRPDWVLMDIKMKDKNLINKGKQINEKGQWTGEGKKRKHVKKMRLSYS